MSIIQAAGSGEVSTGFYKLLLDQSLKFNDDDTQYLTRTPTTAGNRKTWTWSGWVKRGNLSLQRIFTAGTSGSSYFQFRFDTNHEILLSSEQPSTVLYLKTTQKFRDTSAWYHLVLVMDTTQSTAADRTKLYVNGSLVTDFSSTTRPSQNTDLLINSTTAHMIGALSYSVTSGEYDGYMAEINFIDGTALTADSFGETKNGIWIPKNTSGLTFGTNGFHLTFKDDVVSEGFNTAIYTGNDATNRISGIGFRPDFVWLKNRDVSSTHRLHNSLTYGGPYDAGATGSKYLASNANTAETSSSANALISLDADGFSVHGTGNDSNDDGEAYVGWCWEASGAPTATNSAGAGATPTAGSVKIDGSNLGSALAGSIAATKLSANTTKGFSVVSYTGNGSADATVAHGLGATPEWIILKWLGGASNWRIHHTGIGTTHTLFLNRTDGKSTDADRIDGVSSTTFTLSEGNAAINGNGENYIAYCWTPISGYSKFGTYTGNGSSTGPTVTTGFAPAWVVVKRTDSTGDWYVWDTTRHPSNPNDNVLYANLTNAESVGSSYAIEVTATGFQIKHSGADINASSGTFIYMAFADTREAAFFKDVSSNGNHFTPVNLDYRDSVPDTPTNNFATLNPLDNYNTGATLSEGNLKWTIGGADGASRSTHVMTAGKWYVEFLSNNDYIGVVSGKASIVDMNGTQTVYYAQDGTKRVNGSASSYGASYSNGDIIGIALDLDSGTQTVTFYKNNASQGSLNLTDVGNEGYSVSCGSGSGSTNATANFGQDSSFSGAKATSNANADGNGHGSFAYAPPSGYLALCSQNLPEPAIIDGSENFNTVLYTGDGNTGRTVTAVGFSPDFVWTKGRSGNRQHLLFDTVRGNGKYLLSTSTNAEATDTNTLTTFDSDGFTVGDNQNINTNNETYVAWNWLAGTAFSNDASATGVGTIDSTGQVNTTAGFSIVDFTGAGAAGTIAHGLSAAPQFIVYKRRNASGDGWIVYNEGITNSQNGGIYLQSTAAYNNDSTLWNNTAPTASVFSVGSYGGANGENRIAYCFHSVEGYSKVGSYTGNGNADGPFIYLGFRPAFWLMKSASDATHWVIYDSARETFNEVDLQLLPNEVNAEAASSRPVDFLSNGVKIRFSSYLNDSGQTYIYLAFAESPFKFANAR